MQPPILRYTFEILKPYYIKDLIHTISILYLAVCNIYSLYQSYTFDMFM